MDKKPSCIAWQVTRGTDGSKMDILRDAGVGLN